MLRHEELYRGAELLGKLARTRITVCGAGALGSHILDGLARAGAQSMLVIDDCRVEESNICTQLYGREQIGMYKVTAISNTLWQMTGADILGDAKRVTERTVKKLLGSAQLVVDVFDNSASRKVVADYCRSDGIPCLHAGMATEYGEVAWDDVYRVPDDGGVDVCDYPLSRNLVMLTSTLALESLLRFVGDGSRCSWSLTFRDLQVRSYR